MQIEWGPYSWYNGNSDLRTHAVGETIANAVGAHDMSGNVFELCWDWFGTYTESAPYTDANTRGAAQGTDRVVRGGIYNLGAQFIRTAERSEASSGGKSSGTGFRLVRSTF